MRLRGYFGVLWVLGGCAFLLAALRPAWMRPRALEPADSVATARWYDGGFQPGAVYPSTSNDRLPGGAATLGSWQGGDRWQGSVQTRWERLRGGQLVVFVAGYPLDRGCTLRGEFVDGLGKTTAEVCRVSNPGEGWTAWNVPIAREARSFRVIAEDRSAASQGWIAFSQPFVLPPQRWITGFECLQVLATFSLGLTLLWLPGLYAGALVAKQDLLPAMVIGTGPVIMAAIGLTSWLLGAWLPPVVTGECGAGCLWLCLGVLVWREPLPVLTPGMRQAFLAAALCALAAIAKASYSGGPDGELFRGTVERTLAVGNRSDCVTSFRVVQVITQDLAPYSSASARTFAPWTLFTRGPLAGLASAPLVFATAKPHPGPLIEPWQLFDPWGYASYRIAMALLASAAVLALFFALTAWVSEELAAIGACAMALCPFVLHETYFTWPKLAATAWLTLALLHAHRRLPLLTGMALAISYLFHPLALVWAPWIACWLFVRTRDGPRRTLAVASFRFALPLALGVLPWMAAGEIGRRMTGEGHAGQAIFFRYFAWADGYPASMNAWFHTRLMNFGNTFVPFWLHAFGEAHADLNSVYGPAGRLVKFAFSWWNTLPIGMGLILWAWCSAAVVLAWRRVRLGPALACLVAGPAILLTAYWGDASTGLMRECGHPFIPIWIGLGIASLAHVPPWIRRLFLHPSFPWLQLPGAALVCWLTTLRNANPPPQGSAGADGFWLIVNLASLAGIAWVATRCRGDLEAAFRRAGEKRDEGVASTRKRIGGAT